MMGRGRSDADLRIFPAMAASNVLSMFPLNFDDRLELSKPAQSAKQRPHFVSQSDEITSRLTLRLTPGYN